MEQRFSVQFFFKENACTQTVYDNIFRDLNLYFSNQMFHFNHFLAIKRRSYSIPIVRKYESYPEPKNNIIEMHQAFSHLDDD